MELFKIRNITLRATKAFFPSLVALVFSSHALAQDNPIYDDVTSTLTIPVVDSFDRPGQY